ncbi:MAG: exodeoxyribonuclease VII large subunit [Kiritimatiellia bacterium]
MLQQRDLQAWSVTELTRRIKGTLEGAFGAVVVEGEISNLVRPASGHLYFTIKDEGAQIAGVMFKGNQRGLGFEPQNGAVVRAHGEVTVYEKRGNYQILIRRLEPGGKGDLHAQFEALKKRLAAEGLFEASRKRALPMLPQHVGVVTSGTGAAIRDILNVVTRRFPNLHVMLAAVKVQGAGAAEEIAAAIDRLNEIGGLDVLIVGRGGGSLEDLWSFNEEVVARAVARSGVPVISAVGHEIDFTICDFVADVRAPTPSAAAELVVGRKDAFTGLLDEYGRRIRGSMQHVLERGRHRLTRSAGHYVFREPANAVARSRQRLDSLDQRIRRELRGSAQAAQQSLDWMSGSLWQHSRAALQVERQRMDACLRQMQQAVVIREQRARQDVQRLELQMRALNPLGVLQRGYSVTRLADGSILRRSADVRTGDLLQTRVADGEVLSRVSNREERRKDT